MSFRAALPLLLLAALAAHAVVRHVVPRVAGRAEPASAPAGASALLSDGTGGGVAPYREPDSAGVSRAVDAALLKGRYLLGGGSGLRVSRTYRYYDVEGATGEEVARSLRATGPRLTGIEAFAVTEVLADWRMDDPDGGACAAEGLSIDLAFTVTLPRWRQPSGAPGELVLRWRSFEEGVRLHEREHQQITLAVAQGWLARGRALRGRSCDEIRRAMDEEQRLRVEPELRRLQGQYDAEAQAGKRAGPVWTVS